MNHDPLCPNAVRWEGDVPYCQCDLIALIRADERERVTCSHCGGKPRWTNVDTRRGVEVHPWCDCDRTAEVDGHWCDDGCPPRAADIADIRAQIAADIEALPRERRYFSGPEYVVLNDAARIARGDSMKET